MKSTDNVYYKEWKKQAEELVYDLKFSKNKIHLSEYNFKIDGYLMCGVGLIDDNGQTVSFEYNEKEPNIYKIVCSYKGKESSYECYNIKRAEEVMQKFYSECSLPKNISNKQIDVVFNTWKEAEKGFNALDDVNIKKTFWDKVYDGWQGLGHGFNKLVEATHEFYNNHKKSFEKIFSSSMLCLLVLSYQPVKAQGYDSYPWPFSPNYTLRDKTFPGLPSDENLEDNTANLIDKNKTILKETEMVKAMESLLPETTVRDSDTMSEGDVARESILPTTESPKQVAGYGSLTVLNTDLSNPNNNSSGSGSGAATGSNNKVEVEGDITAIKTEYKFNVSDKDIADAIKAAQNGGGSTGGSTSSDSVLVGGTGSSTEEYDQNAINGIPNKTTENKNQVAVDGGTSDGVDGAGSASTEEENQDANAYNIIAKENEQGNVELVLTVLTKNAEKIEDVKDAVKNTKTEDQVQVKNTKTEDQVQVQ